MLVGAWSRGRLALLKVVGAGGKKIIVQRWPSDLNNALGYGQEKKLWAMPATGVLNFDGHSNLLVKANFESLGF